MALLCRPRLLIADEPTTALDVTVQAQIIALLDELRREIGMSILFISHDLGVVSQIADRIVVMRAGELKEEAATKELFSNPKHAYTQELLRAAPRLGAGILLDRPPADQPPVMSVKGLTKRFAIKQGWLRKTVANVHAVENVSFELFPGETLAIVGESGCGKSTLGRTLARLIQPDDGSIILNGVDVTHLSRAALQPLRRNIQMVFQDPYASLNPRLTVCDAITEPLIVHEPQMSREPRRKRAVDLLLRVGLAAEMVDRFPHQFSGGQRQRLCIARALCLGPKIIIADEAVSALDVSVQAQVLELMKQLQQDMGIAFIFISHDMAVVEKVSHRVAVMYLGQIVEIGPTRDVLTNPQHPYTRKLLASVPQTDVERPRSFASLEVSEVPSPLRPLGARIEHPPFIMAGPEHSFQAN
jgi:ABC-type glutathione transport system ATPase component